MSRPVFLHWLFLGLAVLFVACVVAQIFLAGLGVFSSASAFETHREFGFLFGWLALAMLLVAIVGREGRRQILLVLAIIVAFALQSVLVAMRGDAPAVAALHPLNGVLILLLGLAVARSAWTSRPVSPTREAGGSDPTGMEG
jgi:cytochrome b561